MRTIRFFGASDDLVEIRDRDADGQTKTDEFPPLRRDDSGVLKIATPDGEGLYVVVHYLGYVSGTWAVGIAPLEADDDAAPLPAWDMRWGMAGECRHSAELEIDVPDDAVLTIVSPDLGAV